MTELPALRLKKNEERRLRAGHSWIFSNEVDVAATPLTGFSAGQQVMVEDHRGQRIGSAYVNPHSLICARLYGRGEPLALDVSLLVHRLQVALSLRRRLFDRPYYRLVHGESDRLPGVVIDRYGDTVVVQIGTAGMENVRDELLQALNRVVKPVNIVLRNDLPSRALEGLESYSEMTQGSVETVDLEENGVRFRASVVAGQKTGWYYDHRLNRARMAHYVKGKRVLDVFSYVGGWGVQALAAGAEQVVCVDSSAPALELARENAALNGVAERLVTREQDAFTALKDLRAEGERFDVVVLDPPSLIPRKKDVKQGSEAYRALNQRAMQLLSKDGVLISASCSYHFPAAQLKDTILRTARHLDRYVQIVEQGHQGPDHPVDPAIVETEYLKAFFARVLPA